MQYNIDIIRRRCTQVRTAGLGMDGRGARQFFPANKSTTIEINTLVFGLAPDLKSYSQVINKAVDNFVDNQSINNEIMVLDFELNPA